MLLIGDVLTLNQWLTVFATAYRLTTPFKTLLTQVSRSFLVFINHNACRVYRLFIIKVVQMKYMAILSFDPINSDFLLIQ